MPTDTSWIAQALAPGVALTSIIFYNTSLQNRFVYITGRVRELNREARGLRQESPERNAERIRSLRWQVTVMTRRALLIRRAILTLYAGFLSFVLTILFLAAAALTQAGGFRAASLVSFASGFVGLIGAALLSIVEMYLGQSTVLEDIRTSYASEAPEPPALSRLS